MERQSAVADELAVKVDYVRDWLNKAEEAIRKGDTFEAVAKLSLAKADTTNLISNLIPQPKEMHHSRRVPAYNFAWRKLALLAGPFALIGCFLIGLAVGGPQGPDIGTPQLNAPITSHTSRYIARPSFDSQLLALLPNARERLDQPVEAGVGTGEPLAAPIHRAAVSRPVVHTEVPAAPVAAEDTTAETVAEEIPAAAVAEEPLNLFDFGLDVIRSARENMGR